MVIHLKVADLETEPVLSETCFIDKRLDGISYHGNSLYELNDWIIWEEYFNHCKPIGIPFE